jgi:hypothetical protein
MSQRKVARVVLAAGLQWDNVVHIQAILVQHQIEWLLADEAMAALGRMQSLDQGLALVGALAVEE